MDAHPIAAVKCAITAGAAIAAAMWPRGSRVGASAPPGFAMVQSI